MGYIGNVMWDIVDVKMMLMTAQQNEVFQSILPHSHVYNEELLLVLILICYFTLPDETNLKLYCTVLYTVIYYTVIEIVKSNGIENIQLVNKLFGVNCSLFS